MPDEQQSPETPRRRSARVALQGQRAQAQVRRLQQHKSQDEVLITQESVPSTDTGTGTATTNGCTDVGKPFEHTQKPEEKQHGRVYERCLPVLTCEIRYFQQYRDPLSPRQINELVRALVANPFVPYRSVGYVYCFRHPNDADVCVDLTATSSSSSSSSGLPVDLCAPPGTAAVPQAPMRIHPIKIGRARRVPKRLKQWRAQCAYEPVLHFSHRMPEHERVEAIVHAQLANARRREYRGCRTCGSRHDEWFDVVWREADALVRLWQRFTGHRVGPYDALGCLVPRWRERLGAADMDDEKCWAWFTCWEPPFPSTPPPPPPAVAAAAPAAAGVQSSGFQAQETQAGAADGGQVSNQ